MVIIPVLAAACALYSVVVPRSRFSPTLLVASVLVLPLGALLGALATGASAALASANRGPGTAPAARTAG